MRTALVIAASMLLFSIPSTSRACSPCVDAAASFAGEVLIDGVVALNWESDEEDSGLLYVVRRYATSDHSDQSTMVAAVPGVGSCATNRVHGVQDSPDRGTWYYTLEVRNASNTLLCSVPANGGSGLVVED